MSILYVGPECLDCFRPWIGQCLPDCFIKSPDCDKCFFRDSMRCELCDMRKEKKNDR